MHDNFMSPFMRAAMVYQNEVCARTFKEDLYAHYVTGYVISTPTYFVMGRPVLSSATYEEITNPHLSFKEPDCWHLYLYSGPLIHAFLAAPYRLPFVSFERKNILRFYHWDVIARKCGYFTSSN
jgi:hypothetical protein